MLSALTELGGIVPQLLDGFLMTLSISALAAIGALLLSIPLVVARRSSKRRYFYPATFFITLMRGLPIVILIFLCYFGLPALLGIGRVSAFWVGVLVLSLNGSAFISEALRGAISRIPDGQWEASHALGLSTFQTWRLVLTPQFIPIALPSLTGELGFLIKASPALSLITIVDLTRRAQQVAMQTFDPLMPLLAAALLYFLLLGSISILSRWLEDRLEPVGHNT
jgi:His/Glu/Gln/Arg/opine family amino acid ABC transporter permease subunit